MLELFGSGTVHSFSICSFFILCSHYRAKGSEGAPYCRVERQNDKEIMSFEYLYITTIRRSLLQRTWFDDGVHPPPNAEGRVNEILCIGGAYSMCCSSPITLAVAFSGKRKRAVERWRACHRMARAVESPDFGEWIGRPGNAEKHKALCSLPLLLRSKYC